MTKSKSTKDISIAFPHPPGAGGPGRFQDRFEQQLKKSGWQVLYPDRPQTPKLVFIVGGTKKIFWLLKKKLKRIPIVLRLDGINWLHRKKQVSLRDYVRAEIFNVVIKFIHACIADKVIYQSHFVKEWWDKAGWKKHKSYRIIYNGIEISKSLNPQDPGTHKRLVILEGVVDYTPYAIDLLNDLARKLPQDVKIEVYGKFDKQENIKKLNRKINYKGYIEPENIVHAFRGAVYLSLDINPACPNTVIEALSYATPVVGFDTGAIPELVDENCGYIVPYGSNPWDLNYPNVEKLIVAIISVFNNYEKYSKAALERAKLKYNGKDMFIKYTEIFQDLNLTKSA